MYTPAERDEGDRLRRRSAVMRFLSHIRESASERDLMLSVIEAGAVWYDLDARAYRRELDGRFSLEAWLPGTDLSHDPRTLDVAAILSSREPTRISSINELEQLGWQSMQGEVVLLPIVASGEVSRVLVVPGQVETEVEGILVAVCEAAGAVIDELVEQRGEEVRERLARRAGEVDGAFQACVREVAAEFETAVDAAAVRIAVTRPGQPTVTVCSTGESEWALSPLPAVAPGATEAAASRLALGFSLGRGASGVVEFLAADERPFTVDRVQAAEAGLCVLSVWLAGISIGFAKAPGEKPAHAPAEAHAAAPVPPPPAPPFEDAMRDELARADRLSLAGGVLVASLPGAPQPDPRVLSLIIHTVRGELRSADLLGQLAGGDVAAVLVRTSPEGVARAAERVRERLDQRARAGELPPVVLGHALYPAGQIGTPASLVAKARQQAGLMFS